MTARALQQWLCRLGLGVVPADMREWASAMVREIDEIDDQRAALEWAAACFVSCAAQRLRAILRLLAAAARLGLGGYLLFGAWQTVVQIAALVAGGETPPWKIGCWAAISMLVAAAGPLVALRRPAAAWTLCAATVVMAATFFLGAGGGSAEAAAQERAAATMMVGAMLIMTGAVFWLTRRPDADPII